jgi:hypothetical protein
MFDIVVSTFMFSDKVTILDWHPKVGTVQKYRYYKMCHEESSRRTSQILKLRNSRIIVTFASVRRIIRVSVRAAGRLALSSPRAYRPYDTCCRPVGRLTSLVLVPVEGLRSDRFSTSTGSTVPRVNEHAKVRELNCQNSKSRPFWAPKFLPHLQSSSNHDGHHHIGIET